MIGVEHATLGILIIMSVVVAFVLIYIRKSRSIQNMYVRRIAGIDAIDEATGRAAEMGRPVSFCTGLTGVGPTLYACLGVLYHVARKAALYKSKLILPQNDPQVLAISEDVARDAFRNEGKASLFDSSNSVYLSDDQFAFAAGYSGLVQRENVATTFLFGTFAAESLILAEAGQQIGAMQVAASVSPEQVAFFICTCDYTLIGEELYAASAYLTNEAVQMGSLYGQDRAKLLFLVMIIIGVVVATINSLGYEINNLDYYILKELW